MPINQDETWLQIQEWLSEERELQLIRGSRFKAKFDSATEEIVTTPLETGIERRIGREEWIKFVNKFNEVLQNGYDPLRPGHYARTTFNSSYLVTIARHLNAIVPEERT